MRKMKNSGIPWIGEIPEGWNIGKIGHNYSITLGKMIDSKEYASYEMSNYLCAANIKWNGVNIDVNKKMKFSNTEKALYLLQQGDVLIMEGGTAGTACVYNNEFSPCYIQNSVHRCRGLNGNITKYLYYWMNVVFYSGYINSICNRATILHYTKEKVARTPIIIPSINKQNQIVNFLDSKCSEIDTLIENLRARIESAKEYKKAVITEAVTKGLNKDAKMKDSGVEWIGEIPEGWKVVRFKHIASIKSNLVQPDKYMKYPQIAPDNIEKDTGRLLSHQTVEESGVISGNHLFYRGQILYSKIRPNLNKLTVAPFDGLCSADMYPIESKLPTLFMVYSMLSTYFVSQVSLIIQDRVKMPKINQEELGEIKVAVPSQQEMLTIADYLDSKCSEIDALLQNYEYQIATLEEYKKSLIYEYVTGKKEVPEA